jgi:hypothetical protein
MTLTKQGNFTFNHSSQQDDLYKAMSAAEVKAAFDSRANELKSTLNNLIDSLNTIVASNSGADNIGVTAIQDLTGTTVQSILKSLRDTLKSVTNGESGTDFINSAPITGVTGSTLYAQLSSLKGLIDAVYTKSQLDNGQLDTRYYTETELNNGALDTRYFTETELSNGSLDTRYYTETELASTTVGSSGAKKIGATPIATSPGDVQGILEWLKNQMDSTVLGQIPDGAVTIAKLSFDPATQVELEAVKSSVSDGKTLVKNAITGKGGTVLDSDGDGVPTHQELADGVSTIQTSVAINGTAVDGDVLATKTYYNTDAKAQRTGSMPNNAAITITPSASAQAIPAGYHNGSGSVPAVVVPAANVLAGTSIAGTAGTMPNRGAMTITPGTTSQIIPTGFHNGSGTVVGDVDLIASNILNGVNIFGVVGNIVPGKKFTTGSASSGSISSSTTYSVSGLSFSPSKILVTASLNATNEEHAMWMLSSSADLWQLDNVSYVSGAKTAANRASFDAGNIKRFGNGSAAGTVTSNGFSVLADATFTIINLVWWAFE